MTRENKKIFYPIWDFSKNDFNIMASYDYFLSVLYLSDLIIATLSVRGHVFWK